VTETDWQLAEQSRKTPSTSSKQRMQKYKQLTVAKTLCIYTVRSTRSSAPSLINSSTAHCWALAAFSVSFSLWTGNQFDARPLSSYINFSSVERSLYKFNKSVALHCQVAPCKIRRFGGTSCFHPP
jgi:hypothetical protein